MKSHFFSLLFLSISSIHAELLDLEALSQDFVLETKRIEIKGFPHAFNPSIIRWRGFPLLCFRVVIDPKMSSLTSMMGLVWLDDALNPIGAPQLLDIRTDGSQVPPRVDDARLITIDDHLLLVYSDNPDPKISKGGFRMCIAEVDFDGEHFYIENIERLTRFEGESKDRREKNWTPFEYEKNLLLVYSIVPHKIMSPIFGAEACQTLFSTEASFDWNWGELRGGTQGLLDNGQYLAFFHSSINIASVQSGGKSIAHYFMGAYTYSASPPFHITSISPMPILGKGFYTGTVYKPYWKPLLVVFPCGYIANDKYIWVAYGKQDHEAWIAKLDKQALLDSLVPVSN